MNLTKDRETLIRNALDPLTPISLTIYDESGSHEGHAGARSGGGHFIIHIVSSFFTGKSPVARHQMIYQALGSLMTTDIHAISITAKAPGEP